MKYREEIIEGQISTWRRARQMVLDNPLDYYPSVTCLESQATRLPDASAIEKFTGNLSHTMDDPELVIPMVDPDTYEPTEITFMAGEFALMAMSVYLWLARQQDSS